MNIVEQQPVYFVNLQHGTDFRKYRVDVDHFAPKPSVLIENMQNRHHWQHPSWFLNVIADDGPGFFLCFTSHHTIQLEESIDQSYFIWLLTSHLQVVFQHYDYAWDYAKMLRDGIESRGNTYQNGQFFTRVVYPIQGGHLECGCTCSVSFASQFQIEVKCRRDGTLHRAAPFVDHPLTGSVGHACFVDQSVFACLLFALSAPQLSLRGDAQMITMQLVQSSSDIDHFGNRDDVKTIHFEEVIKQVLAINNIPYQQDSFQSEGEVNSYGNAEITVQVNALPETHGIIRVSLERRRVNPGGRFKSLVRRDAEKDFIRAPLYEICLKISSPNYLQPSQNDTEDKQRGVLSYLQKCLNERGLFGTDKSLKDLVHAMRYGGDTQLLVRDVWCPHLLFAGFYRQAELLDMVEDLLRTIKVMACLDFSASLVRPVNPCPDGKRSTGNHNRRCNSLLLDCQDEVHCIFKFDSAGQLVLEICRSDHKTRSKKLAVSTADRPFGPVLLPEKVDEDGDNGDGNNSSNDEENGDDDEDNDCGGDGGEIKGTHDPPVGIKRQNAGSPSHTVLQMCCCLLRARHATYSSTLTKIDCVTF